MLKRRVFLVVQSGPSQPQRYSLTGTLRSLGSVTLLSESEPIFSHPLLCCVEDVHAAQRFLQIYLGWHLNVGKPLDMLLHCYKPSKYKQPPMSHAVGILGIGVPLMTVVVDEISLAPITAVQCQKATFSIVKPMAVVIIMPGFVPLTLVRLTRQENPAGFDSGSKGHGEDFTQDQNT